jgi:hypothetical protein
MPTLLPALQLAATLAWSPTGRLVLDDSAPVTWAGHQVSYGRRDIPFRGEVTTRSESLLLARVRFDGSTVVLSQIACAVRFDEVGGARVSMDAGALPRSQVRFAAGSDGVRYAASSEVQWGEEDLDDDGHPGMTVEVDAPVCAGELYVANRSLSMAQARFDRTRFFGRAKVKVHQRVLGARGRCLSAVAEDTTDVVRGPFAYTEVAPGTTCAQLFAQGWPVDAES